MSVLGAIAGGLKATAAFFGWRDRRQMLEAGQAQAVAKGQEELIDEMVEERDLDRRIDSDPAERDRLLGKYRERP